MGKKERELSGNRVLVWIAALLVSLLLFYALDHVIMSMQGLPLDWYLTTAK